MYSPLRALVVIVALAATALPLTLATPALAATPPSNLNGEAFYAPNAFLLPPASPFISTAICSPDPLGNSTISLTADGAASGPYPGTFTEQVTAVVTPGDPANLQTPGLVDQPGTPMGYTVGLHAAFTITSGTTTITGTQDFVTAQSSGLCADFMAPLYYNGPTGLVIPFSEVLFDARTSYTATIHTPDGSFADTGTGAAYNEWQIAHATPSSIGNSGFGGRFASTTVPTPVGDANGDGIIDSLQPAGTPAGSFLDASLTPPTFGRIVSTGGLSVTITDALDPLKGIVVTVGPGAPGAYVELSVCATAFTVLLGPNTTVIGTCGSVTLDVATGTARVVLGGGITVVSIPSGGAAKVADTGNGSYSIANLGAVGSPSVSLTVDGTTRLISAGAMTTAETWHFVGFAQPIDNLPTLNRVKAGQAVPVKWRLLSSTGAPVTNLTSATFSVTDLGCALGATIDQIEEVTTGASGLQNLGNGYYQLNWKSPATYAASCKTLRLDMNDGVTHDAAFQFTK